MPTREEMEYLVQRITELKRQGCTTKAIAERLGISERRVLRLHGRSKAIGISR